jgi:hypothetical protein
MWLLALFFLILGYSCALSYILIQSIYRDSSYQITSHASMILCGFLRG